LKQIADEMESYRVIKLWHYEVAISAAKEAHRSLFAILRDEDQRELILCEWGYKNAVEQRTKYLLERRLQKNERKEKYLEAEEKAISARKEHRANQGKDRGGCSYNIFSWMIEEKVVAPG
jgi:hypothetical protein